MTRTVQNGPSKATAIAAANSALSGINAALEEEKAALEAERELDDELDAMDDLEDMFEPPASAGLTLVAVGGLDLFAGEDNPPSPPQVPEEDGEHSSIERPRGTHFVHHSYVRRPAGA